MRREQHGAVSVPIKTGQPNMLQDVLQTLQKSQPEGKRVAIWTAGSLGLCAAMHTAVHSVKWQHGVQLMMRQEEILL